MKLQGLDKEDQKKLIAAAVRRLERMKIAECFDPIDLDSRPTDPQQAIFDGILEYKHRYIRAGNQCLEEGTLVATPRGPVAIEDIQVGDTVYDEHGQEIKVKKTFDNGYAEVADITYRGKTWASCTQGHVWQVESQRSVIKEVQASEFTKDMYIRRNSIKSSLGEFKEPHAYAIGALLGDGCSKEPRKDIYISSLDERVPEKIATILESSPRKLHPDNYTWSLQTSRCNHYEEWCKGKYAHEKIVDMETIKSWNRESLLEFVAGVIDTDGSVYPSRDHVSIAITMQAEAVIDALEYAFLALWNVPMNRSLDDRVKYKNGPCHTLYTRNRNYVQHIMHELDPYLVSSQKKWRKEYENLGGKKSQLNKISAVWGKNKRIAKVYDIHVGSLTNLYTLANGLVTHNSGKTQVGAREVSWILEESHPTWKRPEEWKDEPLQIIVVGRVSRQVEDSIWRKIKGYLNPGEYKEVRSGGALQKVTHTNGNSIIFASHHAENEAREKLQSYTAHYVWIDEMPSSFKIIEELHQRITARNGYFLATFTPKVKNDSIRKFVDTQEKQTYAHVYRLSKLDNPAYAHRKDEIIAQTEGYSEAYKQAVLYGDWLKDDLLVYDFDSTVTVVEQLPRNYSPAWRHVEAVDPALQSKLGFILLTEDPKTAYWYIIKAEYVKGIAVPDELVKNVVERTQGYNIVARTSDVAPWYVNTANSLRIRPSYMTVREKTIRKGELIKGLQTALGTKIFIASWCSDLIDELMTCAWSETVADKIVNAQSYHLLDALQYGVDILPRPVHKIDAPNRDAYLRQHHEKALNEQAAQPQQKTTGMRKSYKIGRKRGW